MKRHRRASPRQVPSSSGQAERAVGGPFNSGIPAGRDTWNYETAPPETAARPKTIDAVCERHGVPLPAAALQFPLAHPAVAAVILGPRDVAEFADNLKLLQLPFPSALRADLRAEKLLHPDALTGADNSADIPLSAELIPLFGRKIPLFGRVAEFAKIHVTSITCLLRLGPQSA